VYTLIVHLLCGDRVYLDAPTDGIARWMAANIVQAGAVERHEGGGETRHPPHQVLKVVVEPKEAP
jgi:hypothetical protein